MNENFMRKKIYTLKVPAGIHSIYNCAKFQHDWAIFDFSKFCI